MKDVRELTRLGETKLREMIDAGKFPRAKQVGPRAVRWQMSDVEAWISSVCRTRRASSTTTDRHEDGRIFGAEWGHILVALVLAAVLIWRMARRRQKAVETDAEV